MEAAARIVSRAMAITPPHARAELLREILAHAAAGLALAEGHTEAAEAVYRLADAMVARPTRQG